MSPIPHFSLTDLTRSTAPLWQAVADHHLAVLTRHSKAALAVLSVNDLLRLLRVAEQAVGLLYRPDLLQVSAVLTATQQTRLGDEVEWFINCLRELPDELGQNS